MGRLALIASTVMGLSACVYFAADSASRVALDRIRLPPGFQISVFADNVPGPRSLAHGKGEVVFVGTRRREYASAAAPQQHSSQSLQPASQPARPTH